MALASSDAAQRRGLLGWLLVFNLPLLMIVMELSVYAFEPACCRFATSLTSQPIELSLRLRLRADGGHSDARLRSVAGRRGFHGQRERRSP
jgi:hypothetical protein